MSEHSSILRLKVEAFINRYYKNELIKGAILALTGVVLVILVVSLLEYLGRFGSTQRTALFFSSVIAAVVLISYFLVRPVLGLMKLGKRMSSKDASALIGSHFPQVGDKLINALQLESSGDLTENSLLFAAIQQKTEELKPVPFTGAIDFKKNLKYGKLAIVPVVLFLLGWILLPGFRYSTERVALYNREFLPEAPFHFVVDSLPNEVVADNDLPIHVQLAGAEIPTEVFVESNGTKIRMKGNHKDGFYYAFKRLRNPMNLRFYADGFYSKEHHVKVLKRPTIADLTAVLLFPDYLQRSPEQVKNAGEFEVPEGTRVNWTLQTNYVDNVRVKKSGNELPVDQDRGKFQFKSIFKNNADLTILPENEEAGTVDSLIYRIRVTKDRYPEIKVDENRDSASGALVYFKGEISDDHGFSKLRFVYKRLAANSDSSSQNREELSVRTNPSAQRFVHAFDLAQLDLVPGETVVYYFEVWDNDGVNGAKSAKSALMEFKVPSLEEINSETDKMNEEIKQTLSKNKSENQAIRKKIDDIRQQLTEKKSLSWEEKKKMEDLLNEVKKEQEEMEKVIEQNKSKNAREQEFKELDENLLEKQKQLEELFDEVMNDEMKELMKKIEELLEKNNKEQLQEKLNQMKFSQQEMKKKMDRMLELFKELELEKKVNETVEELKKLAEEQKKLAEKTEDKKQSTEELREKQDELGKKFEEVKKDLESIDKKNNELEQPKKLENDKLDRKDVQQEMKQGSKELQQEQRGKAKKHQQNAAEKMKEMAEGLQQSMASAQMEQQMEDMAALRQILENLVQLSFDQEELISKFKENPRYNDAYVADRQTQRRIKDDAAIVEDSLLALSKRVIQLENFINKEIGRVNSNLDEALYFLGERRTYNALSKQQYVMTGFNNLAVMLSEVLKQMQQQMKQQMQSSSSQSGNKSCNNPKQGKGKKPSMGAIKKMQKELAKQLEELQKGMKKGGKKPGSQGFAEAAAQQAAIRQKLRELQRELNKEGDGKKLGDLQRTQELMDDVEEDLVNKKIRNETINRLKEIEFRLLQHEKAEKEQEEEETRQSKEGQDVKRPMPPSLEQFLEEQEKQSEMLKTVPLNLSPYYKKQVEQFFSQP